MQELGMESFVKDLQNLDSSLKQKDQKKKEVKKQVQ